jgi:hypothetical protein
MPEALVVAPKFDDATVYSYNWSREVVDELRAHGYTVTDIGGRPVRRSEVEEQLRRLPSALYIHYNHGSEDAHWGTATEAVVDLQNVDLLSGREVYCMNCESAKVLGAEAVKRGCLVYWGYTDVFAFTSDAPAEFKQFANAGIKHRLSGLSWKEALERVKKLGEELREKLFSEGKFVAASAMQHDTDVLVCYQKGDEPPKEKSWLDELLEWIRRIVEWIRKIIRGEG